MFTRKQEESRQTDRTKAETKDLGGGVREILIELRKLTVVVDRSSEVSVDRAFLEDTTVQVHDVIRPPYLFPYRHVGRPHRVHDTQWDDPTDLFNLPVSGFGQYKPGASRRHALSQKSPSSLPSY